MISQFKSPPEFKMKMLNVIKVYVSLIDISFKKAMDKDVFALHFKVECHRRAHNVYS